MNQNDDGDHGDDYRDILTNVSFMMPSQYCSQNDQLKAMLSAIPPGYNLSVTDAKLSQHLFISG